MIITTIISLILGTASGIIALVILFKDFGEDYKMDSYKPLFFGLYLFCSLSFFAVALKGYAL